MKKNLISLILISLISFSVRSQISVNLTWADAIGAISPGDESVNGSFVDAAGNVYITGKISSATDFDPSAASYTLPGFYSCYFAKYNAGGSLVWANVITGGGITDGIGIGTDATGNVYLTGKFNGGTADFDPSASVFNLTPAQSDMFIAKYTSSGAFVWAQGIGALSSNVSVECLKVDAAGDIIVGGSFSGIIPMDFNPTGPTYTLSSNIFDGFVAKYSPSGLIQWAYGFGDMMNDYVHWIETDVNNNVFVIGDFQLSIALNPAAPTSTTISQGIQDGFAIKFSPTGTYQWGNVVGGVNGDGYYRAKLDNAGDLIISGYMGSLVMDADPAATTFTLAKVSSSSDDSFIAKHNSSTGNLIWAMNTGGNGTIILNGVTTDSQNNIYATGYFDDATDFDYSTTGSYSLSPVTVGIPDVFLTKYDPTGTKIFANTFGGGTLGNGGRSVNVDNSNNILLVGSHSFSVNVDFNATNNIASFGGSDIFMVKYSQCIDASVPTITTAMLSQTICANSVATISISGGNLNSATNWVWTSVVCGSGTIGVGTTVTVSPVFLTEYFVRGEGGCTSPGPCANASVFVTPTKGITGTVTTGASIPVVGKVQLFRYEGALTKWDSVTYQNVNASGVYSFNAVNEGSYIIMSVPNSNSLVTTYAPNNATWKNSTVFGHGCLVDKFINIDVVPLTTVTPGPGVLAGKIVEGVNYGGRGTSVAPGSPIGGLTIKGGKNPGGNIVAQARTNSVGEFTISGLPVSLAGESYFLFLDIPGIDTAGTHHKAITTGTTMYTDLDFLVDSDYVRPIDYTAIKELNLDGEMVKVYPNPAKDLVYIKLDAKNVSNITLELFDMFGKKVISENYSAVQSEFKAGIDVAKLNRGIYFVKVKLNAGEARIKLVLTE